MIPGSEKSPGEENGNLPLVFLPGEFHGQRSLAGLQSMVLHTVGHNLATKQQQYGLQYFRWKSLFSASVKKKKFPPLKVRSKLEKLFYKLENFSDSQPRSRYKNLKQKKFLFWIRA